MQTLITQQKRYDYAALKIRSLAPELKPRVVFDVGAGKGPMQDPSEQAGLAWHGFDLYPENRRSSLGTWPIRARHAERKPA
jgi:hypothetical protein